MKIWGIVNIVVGLAVIFHLLFVHPTVFEYTGSLATGYWFVFGLGCVVLLLGLIMLIFAKEG